ncbi:hypothetical protein NQZ68_002755 [Dissostichus eleginoides]|nr:hypothetical protein NQZ68_002755 [Dissostichus eleginoides]
MSVLKIYFILGSFVTAWPEAQRRLDVYLLSTPYGEERNPLGAVDTGRRYFLQNRDSGSRV